jgi:hypothetical protein
VAVWVITVLACRNHIKRAKAHTTNRGWVITVLASKERKKGAKAQMTYRSFLLIWKMSSQTFVCALRSMFVPATESQILSIIESLTWVVACVRACVRACVCVCVCVYVCVRARDQRKSV